MQTVEVPYLNLELLREGVHHRDPNAVKAAGHLATSHYTLDPNAVKAAGHLTTSHYTSSVYFISYTVYLIL